MMDHLFFREIKVCSFTSKVLRCTLCKVALSILSLMARNGLEVERASCSCQLWLASSCGGDLTGK